MLETIKLISLVIEFIICLVAIGLPLVCFVFWASFKLMANYSRVAAFRILGTINSGQLSIVLGWWIVGFLGHVYLVRALRTLGL